MPNSTDAYESGAAAYGRGSSYRSNPYGSFDRLYDEWAQGWREAEGSSRLIIATKTKENP